MQNQIRYKRQEMDKKNPICVTGRRQPCVTTKNILYLQYSFYESASLFNINGLTLFYCKTPLNGHLNLYAPTLQNGQTHSNNSSATVDELLEFV